MRDAVGWWPESGGREEGGAGVTRSTAPLRISVAGGGIDMPEYYRHGTTRVCALTVNLFVRVAVGDDPAAVRAALPGDPTYRLGPEETAAHPYLAAARRVLGLARAPRVAVASDVLPGSGLGGSGAFTVALLDALSRHHGRVLPRPRLARLAFQVERRELRRTVGPQDGWVAATGGAVRMTFRPDGTGGAVADPELFAALAPLLESGLLLLRVGRQRDAGRILAGTRRVTARDFAEATAGAQALERAYLSGDLGRIGRTLRAQWNAKIRRNPSVDHPVCRRLGEADAPAGLHGFKLVGAGGGGHLLVAAASGRRTEVVRFLEGLGLRHVPVRAWPRGLERHVPGPGPWPGPGPGVGRGARGDRPGVRRSAGPGR